MNFSKYYKEDLKFQMTNQNLIKILRYANIIGKQEHEIKEYEIDSILKKVNPKSKKFSLKDFENLLVYLSNRFDPNFKNDPKSSMAKFLKKYFEPLDFYIEEQIQNKQNIQNANGNGNGDFYQYKIVQRYLNMVHIDVNTIYLLNSIYGGIKHLYNCYFAFENNNVKEQDKIYKNSIEGLIRFCKDFEIMNHIASIDTIATYFTFLIEMKQEEITKNLDFSLIFEKQKDTGKLFTLAKFAAFLVHISVILYEKNSRYLNLNNNNDNENNNNNNNNYNSNQNEFYLYNNISNSEKLIILLDKFDSNSNCIEKLELKGNKGYTSKISLMPTMDIINKVK
jgi:hypothetical protein